MKTYYIFNEPLLGARRNQVVVTDRYGQVFLDGGTQRNILSQSDIRTLNLGRVIEELVKEDELPEMTDAQYVKWHKESVLVDGVRMGRKPKCLGSPDRRLPLEDYLPLTAAGIAEKMKSIQEINETSDAE